MRKGFTKLLFFAFLFLILISAGASAAPYIDFDDDYDYKDNGYDGNDDGIAWGGDYLDQGVDSKLSGTDIICYDWCGGGIDRCFYKDEDRLNKCRKWSTFLPDFCAKGTCDKTSSYSGDWAVPTGSSGQAWTCPVQARLYANCGTGKDMWQDTAVDNYYIINQREYVCDSKGGTYSDKGNYDSGWVTLKSGISCGNKKGCDTSKDEASFGSKGRTYPGEPCSMFDGEYDCEDNKDCFPGSHCSEVAGWDYCCPDGTDWDGSKCAAPKCSINKAYWDRSEAFEGEQVKLTADGESSCNGKTADFVIKEKDDFGGDDDVNSNPPSKTFRNGKAETYWNAEWQADGLFGLGDTPEYYFQVKVSEDNVEKKSDEPLLVVKKPCIDSDNDGYGIGDYRDECGYSGLDCNDNDKSINPGASEICDGKDNDCDGKIPSNENDNDGDGYRACSNDCNDSDGSVNPGKTEKCNGKDDNCNSQKDESFSADTCSFLCTNDKTPNDDGISYDSGLFDSGNSGTPDCCGNTNNEYYFTQGGAGCCDEITDCVDYYGTCFNSGGGSPWWRCQNHEWSEACTNNEHTACSKFNEYTCTLKDGQWEWRKELPKEACNNIDDDCDGAIDDGLTETKTCGEGICAGGIQTKACSAGQWNEWSECSTDSKETEETCNNLDDDCDGRTDEENVCCDIPDGTTASCECDFDSDCPESYYCSQVSGWDACEKKACTDECTNTNAYYCQYSSVYRCEDFDDDGCSEKRAVDVCGPKEKCVEGQSECQQASFPVQLFIEDSAYNTVKIYKQRGDMIELDIVSAQPQNIQFTAPSTFELVSGSCFSAEMPVKSGSNKCAFLISENTEAKTQHITAAEKTAEISIIKQPKTIIVTNKEKLVDRYRDKAEVDKMLKQAYQKAAEQKDTVIYYLDKEISGHPFESFSSYHQDPLTPGMTGNAYSMDVAGFIKQKCNGCKNVIILGDDYVVPFYRRNITNLDDYIISTTEDVNWLYTDFPYIPRTKKTFVDLNEIFVEKNVPNKVKFVIPITMDAEMANEVDNLKSIIKNNWGSSIHQTQSDNVGCNSQASLKDYTLVIIGTEQNNNLVSCLPFVEGINELENTVSIEKNVWSDDKYAIIINTEDQEIMKAFNYLIKNELLYNADESNLLFEGASLDECEIVGAVPPIDLVGDVCSLVNDCIVKDNLGWCSFDTVIVFVPYGSAAVAKTIIKLFSLGSVGVKFVMKFGIDSMSHFTVLLHESKATTTKVIDILNDVPIKQSSALTRRTLKIVKHYDGVENGVEVLADLKKVAKLDGSDRLIKNFDDQLENTEALKGPEYHAKLAANRLDTAGDKLRLEKDYAVNYFDPIDNKMKPGKADFDIVDENDIQRIGIEAKSGKLDVSSAAPKHMREDLLRKLHRMDAAVNLKKVDKAVINVPSMSNVDTSVKQYIDENNLKVIIEEVNP